MHDLLQILVSGPNKSNVSVIWNWNLRNGISRTRACTNWNLRIRWSMTCGRREYRWQPDCQWARVHVIRAFRPVPSQSECHRSDCTIDPAPIPFGNQSASPHWQSTVVSCATDWACSIRAERPSRNFQFYLYNCAPDSGCLSDSSTPNSRFSAER